MSDPAAVAEHALRAIVRPALDDLPEFLRGERAERMLLAACYQESKLEHRIQVGRDNKPKPHLARGIAQFELGSYEHCSGVCGTLQHKAAAWWLHPQLRRAGYDPTKPSAIHHMLAFDDRLAVWIARALLWTDPKPLPAESQMGIAYSYYNRCWRPGARRPHDWPVSWSAASAACAACRVLVA